MIRTPKHAQRIFFSLKKSFYSCKYPGGLNQVWKEKEAIQGENNYDEDNNDDKNEFISIRNFLISFVVLVAL